MARSRASTWSYKTGEWGCNRVRLAEDVSRGGRLFVSSRTGWPQSTAVRLAPGSRAFQAADPDMLRVRPVNAETFWEDPKKALDANPVVGPDDAPMADQARTLLALRDSDASWRALLDRVALAADAELHGRAQAAVVYIFVNDYHEAIYFIRGTETKPSTLAATRCLPSQRSTSRRSLSPARSSE